MENVIGRLKKFKIIADKYLNHLRKRSFSSTLTHIVIINLGGKRLGLRFNLIAGIYNMELSL